MSDTVMDDKKVNTSPHVHEDSSSCAEGHVGDIEGGRSVRELHRTFTSRHIQMICLGGCIGSGIFISTGKALAVMNVLTENTCLFPTTGSFIDHAARFVDPALGFAIGFCEWTAWMTVVSAEGAIVRVILTYWTDAVPTAACMTVYLALVFGIHALPNRWFGEFEFATAAAKVTAMVIILFACIAMLAGAGPTGSTDHAANYNELKVFPNGFKGVCQTFTLAAWATGGQEIMGITAGEARKPRWDMPRACTNLFVRIIFFYELSTIFIGLLVRYDDERLLATGTVASSPFVIAMTNAGIKGLPDLMNVVIIIGLVAIGAEAMYIASRAMQAMSRMGMMPSILGRVDKKGRPYYALLVTGVFATVMTYINVSNTGAIIFTWFSSIASTVYFMAWMTISLSNWQMHRAIKMQNDPAWKLPHAFKLRAFPLTSVYLFVFSFLVLFATGYVSLFPIGAKPSAEAFFQTFLGVPIFIVAYFGYKIVFRTKFVHPKDADLKTGRRLLTDEDIAFLDAYYAQPMWKRALSYVRF